MSGSGHERNGVGAERAEDDRRPFASLRVLLIEDDLDVRRTIARMVRSLGPEVETAEHGPAAIERYEAGERFDLVVSDVVMPGGISGPQLVDTLADRFGAEHFLLITGYAFEQLGDEAFFQRHRVELLQKPFTDDDLIRAARSIGLLGYSAGQW